MRFPAFMATASTLLGKKSLQHSGRRQNESAHSRRHPQRFFFRKNALYIPAESAAKRSCEVKNPGKTPSRQISEPLELHSISGMLIMMMTERDCEQTQADSEGSSKLYQSSSGGPA